MLITNFYSEINLGMFCKASDKVCIIGEQFLNKYKNKIENELKVNVVGAKIYNTNLIGLFCAFNSNGIILTKLSYKEEIPNFKRLFDNVLVLDSKYTAIGNLILCNDKGAIISKKFNEKERKIIEEVLNVETIRFKYANSNLVGSCGLATNKGCIVHKNTKESEIEKIKDILKVNVDIGTANLGSPHLGSCIIANSNGLIVSEKTTAIEINRIIEALGFA